MMKCGGCLYGKIVPQDLSKRACWGSPPHIVMMPKGPANARPLVDVNDDGCALHAPKLKAEELEMNGKPSIM